MCVGVMCRESHPNALSMLLREFGPHHLLWGLHYCVCVCVWVCESVTVSLSVPLHTTFKMITCDQNIYVRKADCHNRIANDNVYYTLLYILFALPLLL